MTKLTTLGPYTLIRRLAVGGMAELYLAKKTGGLGFEKYYAIKVLLPQNSGDEEHEKTMIDEARLTSQLRHDNIVAVLDLDKDHNRTYMVMEYVRGHDLSVLVEKLRQARGMLALEIAAYVTREICAGLHYVHTRVGSDGRPLHLVHRDVSPQNVLVGVDGEVKLIDFGVAKARGKGRVETKTGIIKGKLKYMAPEYAVGNLQDARSDIFAAGLILYELITGGPAYDESELAPSEFLERIKFARVPHPSERRSDIPPDLEKVVAKSLALHPDKRYSSALEMQHDLSLYLSRTAPHFSKSHCSVYFQSVYQRLGILPEMPQTINADSDELPPQLRRELSIEHALDDTGRVQLAADDVAQAIEKTGELKIPYADDAHTLEPTAQLEVLSRDPSAPRIVSLSKFTELYKHPDEPKIAAVEPRDIRVEFEPILTDISAMDIEPIEDEPDSRNVTPALEDPTGWDPDMQESDTGRIGGVLGHPDEETSLISRAPTDEYDEENDTSTNILPANTAVPALPDPEPEPIPVQAPRQVAKPGPTIRPAPVPVPTYNLDDTPNPAFSKSIPVSNLPKPMPPKPAQAPNFAAPIADQSNSLPISPTFNQHPAPSPVQPSFAQAPQPFGAFQNQPAKNPTGDFPSMSPIAPPGLTGNLAAPSAKPIPDKKALSVHEEGVKQGTHKPFKLTDEEEQSERSNAHSQKLKVMVAMMVLVIVLGITLMIYV